MIAVFPRAASSCIIRGVERGQVPAALGTARYWHTATLLPNGKVLVAGGTDDTNYPPTTYLSSAELYDPASGTWTATGRLGHRTPVAHGDVVALRQGAGGGGTW